jgi:hypothetical protein
VPPQYFPLASCIAKELVPLLSGARQLGRNDHRQVLPENRCTGVPLESGARDFEDLDGTTARSKVGAPLSMLVEQPLLADNIRAPTHDDRLVDLDVDLALVDNPQAICAVAATTEKIMALDRAESRP